MLKKATPQRIAGQHRVSAIYQAAAIFIIFFSCLPGIAATSSQSAPALSEISDSNTVANQRQTHQQLQQQLDAYLAEMTSEQPFSRAEFEFVLPDERLNLEYCGSPLNFENRSPNRNYGRLTLRVSCDGAEKPWSINIGVQIKAFDQVVVAARPIPKGAKITAAMVHQEEREITMMHSGYFTQTEHVIGAIARFAVSGNRALKPGNILPPSLVTKGEKVVIHANTGGIKIRASGIALNDGALGELVRVKNSQTERIIEGRVSAAGRVTVSM